MKETKVYCGHCGKQLDVMRDFDDTTIELSHKWYTADLCAECLDSLYEMIVTFCSKSGDEL